MVEQITNRNLTKGFGEILIYLNDVTNSWFSNMFLFAIWIIIAFSIYNNRQDFGEALSASGFVVAILGTLFWIAGFVGGYSLAICIGLAILGFVFLLIERKQ